MDLDGSNLSFGSASGLLCIQEGGSYGIRHQRVKAKVSPAQRMAKPFRVGRHGKEFLNNSLNWIYDLYQTSMRQKKMNEVTHMKKKSRICYFLFLDSDILFFPQLSQPLVVLRLQVGILMY